MQRMELHDGGRQAYHAEYDQLQRRLKRIDDEQDPAAALTVLLKRCRQVEHGKLIHAHIATSEVYKRDKLLLNMLVEMYGKCGSIAEACCVFDCMSVRNVHSWTIMLVALAENGECKQAVRLFREMLLEGVKPNAFTLTSALTACGHAGDADEGHRIDGMIACTQLRVDVAVCNALISMYGKCGWLDQAKAVFHSMPCKNDISWTAMIDAYCQRREWARALECFHGMDLEGVRACEMSLLAALEAVRGVERLEQGEHIHARIVEQGWGSDPFLCTALVALYSRCGATEGARAVFRKMDSLEVESWNAIMSAAGGGEALELFSRMLQLGVKPVAISVVAAMEACGKVCDGARTRKLEEAIVWDAFDANPVVTSALMDAYAKCGRLDDARRVFDTYRCMGMCSCVDVVAWSTLIAAYAESGDSEYALWLLYTMELHGIQPNAVTLLSILFACSHAGWVEHGCHLLASMWRDRGLYPSSQHYSCVVDMLGRAGWLLDAERLVCSMPIQPDSVALTSLLGAYTLHGGLRLSPYFQQIMGYATLPHNTDSSRKERITIESQLH
ncbi:pentatricopeptide repeat-containing protein At5g27110 [Selaginella moellendorffii]|uniref:pentatricopeptide repeat-containing protein At5g27110 n=1 Tax=Selaginella moellendorffii TaxID=88036 RepID=UPI000D1C29B0|nr:pentatricopeptide repeat-containing protein At5g27110 [Selaginella moellendorffii]|eukprot:XP_024542257.1 pentatricopeptide repeat-containing protein At5g27110 [Selaginella moellendorffii]